MHAVIVEGIGWGGLEVPYPLARLGPHREHGVGEQVVAFARPRVPRRGIANAPVDQVEFRIVGAGHPAAAAAGHI